MLLALSDVSFRIKGWIGRRPDQQPLAVIRPSLVEIMLVVL